MRAWLKGPSAGGTRGLWGWAELSGNSHCPMLLWVFGQFHILNVAFFFGESVPTSYYFGRRDLNVLCRDHTVRMFNDFIRFEFIWPRPAALFLFTCLHSRVRERRGKPLSGERCLMAEAR